MGKFKKPEKHYSGKNSRDFWKRVNKLRGGNHQELYSLGVMLQCNEEYVLQQLLNAEMAQRV